MYIYVCIYIYMYVCEPASWVRARGWETVRDDLVLCIYMHTQD